MAVNKMIGRALAPAVLAVLAGTLPAGADDTTTRTVDRTVDLGGAHAVYVNSQAGDIHVTASDTNQVTVHARLRGRQDDIDHLDVKITQDGDAIRISSVTPSRTIFNWSHRNANIDYTIGMPAGVRQSIENVAGDVIIDQPRGPVSVRDSYGDIRINGAAQNVDAGTKTGDVDVNLDQSWHGNSLVLWTTVGDIGLRAPSALRGSVTAKTRIGEVRGVDRFSSDGHDGPTISLATTIGDVSLAAI